MADLDRLTTEVEIDVRTVGGADAIRQAGQLGAAMDKLADAQDRTANSNTKATAAQERAARAKEQAAAMNARLQRQYEAEIKAIGAMEAAQNAAAAATGGLSAAQARAAAAVQKASNENVAALGRETSAYGEAGRAALHHPLLAAAGASIAAKALSGLATSAGTSLGAASTAAARFGAENAAMGPAVATAAALAARGLATASTAATAAGGTFGAVGEKVGGLTAGTALLSRALATVPPAAIPIAAALAVFAVGALAIQKANSDLDRLIQLGERAKGLDIAAPFVRSFESLGPAIRASADEMDAALKRASGLVKDNFNSENAAGKLLRDISATGVAGAGGLKAEGQFNAAGSTQERIQAALAGMKELEELGLRLAALDLGSKVFGPELIERLRTGNVSITEFADRVEAAAQKELLKQEEVDRAVALNRAIGDAKQGISDALGVTFDFSAAGMLVNEAWVKILQAVRWILEALNDGIAAVTNFGAAVATSIGGAFDAVTAKATALLGALGLVAKAQAAAEVQGPAEAFGPNLPRITAVQRNDISGPPAPSFSQANAGAKQAKQAAQEAASSYDLLIQKTKDHIEELNLEAQYVGKDADAVIKLKLAHQLARAAQKDGTTVTAEMRGEWDKLGDTLAESTRRLEESKRAFEGMKEGQRELASDFTTFANDLILGGKKMDEAFQGLAKTLSSNTLQALISGQGPLAQILGTASNEKGQLGGLLGGKLDFGGLLNSDKIADSLGIGAESGLGRAMSVWLKEQKAGGGFFSSPLGQGVAAAGAGASVGYSSQSPIMGALSGALAGAMTGNPYAAAAGGIAGIAGGACGHKPSRKKDRDRERSKRLRQFA